MNNLQLTHIPVAKAEMLIRKSVVEVFEAFINPEITTKFWFTKSKGGFTWVLAGLKAYLEHGIELNLIGDAFPRGLREH